MAILLIKMRDSADPVNAGAKNDCWEVREDDSPLGNKECLPLYMVIRVYGKKVELQYLTEPITEPELKFDPVTLEHHVEKKTVKLRKYQFDVSVNVSKERMAQIEKSQEWLVDSFEPTACKAKA